ncbi:DNA polymerase III subunit alpha [Campylobacter geochelonis]|uniref:DNA polymerase III subunit alpha n=1 Tax=Campylobacter geochelonis TaxID=1780362 RepID=UPI0007707947|nr:DNA polymerase III subunit alpha [Campylobacter geochelonis]CZE48451.1 DNA polymerase III subunit alpha [Campylobacter geochelonis]CZE51202.1 DNA polymerase III subunit alpha [Campylobacter geochelonis]
MSEFTHLHLHTEYSLLDGANKIGELAKTLKERGSTSVAMTDHGNMFGAIDFYKTMRKNGIKPIIGIEAYIHNHDEINDTSDKQRFHLILLAKNEAGYKNLMYLSSMAYLDGFYYNPRINKKVLKEHSDGIVCSSACLQGEVSFHLNQSERNLKRGAKGYERAKEVALEYKEIFGDDFYLEIMRHGIGDQLKIDDMLIRLSKETGIKLIATNDTHYTFKSRANAHEAFMCIAMGKTIDDPNRLKHSVHEFYVKTDDEMKALFADIPEAISNTQEICDKCNLSFAFDNKDYRPTPPNFKFSIEYAKDLGLNLPKPDERYSKENDDFLFRYESRRGLENRLKFIDQSKHQDYKERLEIELDIIENMGFSGYMLIVYDFIKWAKENDIPVGPGRGSAAGSLCAYSLRITDLDPLPYNLLFERFLNPARISMPDIDVDFCQERRGKVIDYVVEKYGKANVAQVATFGKLLARGVIRDVARVCDMPLRDADAMAKLIPEILGITLNGDGDPQSPKYKPGAYQLEPKLKELIENNAMATRVWKLALDLEGLNRNAGMHAAGVVISNEPLWSKVPLFRQTKNDDGHYITQYTKDYLEDVDLIKFDFLGLKNLDVIDNAIKLVKMRYNKDIVWENIDFNDPRTYKTIQSGNNLGLFQIEGAGMQDLASSLKPDCFEDIIAMISLYRPGPMDLIPDFIARKHGRAKVEYLMNEVKDILEPTYGIIVYQEQVMQIVQKIGGFSLGEADLVRRAMGKKEEKKLAAMKAQYLDGAKNLGYDVKKADELFELIMKFASYGFNKSHAAAYSMITFQTAYLKTYYPAEFMAALLTAEENNIDKVAKYIDEIKRLDIDILPPSINNSYRQFSVIQKDGKDAIIFGMGAIKGVGYGAIENIVKERENGEFKDINDFVSRIDSFKVNKRVIDSLIKAGAMDCLGLSRKTLVQNIESITDACRSSAKIKNDAQNSLFGLEDGIAEVEVNLVENGGEFDLKTLLKLEKESLGIYISGHPLDEYADLIKDVKYTLTSEFEELEQITETILVGKIEEIDVKITKSGKKMGIVSVIDLHGNFEMVVFDNVLKDLERLDKDELDMPHAFRVRIIKDESQYKITLNEFLTIEEVKNGDFKKKSYNKGNGYASKNGGANGYKKSDEVARVIENYEFFIELAKLDKERIDKIYRFAYASNNPKNSKKLILKVAFNSKIFIYETNFFIDESFINKVNEILVA